jgi:hypothetical protein
MRWKAANCVDHVGSADPLRIGTGATEAAFNLSDKRAEKSSCKWVTRQSGYSE